MSEEEPDIDLPEGWEARTYRLSGNFKLIARYEHEESGAEVRVTPFKTYEQPGFANAHRIILVTPNDGVTEVAVGMEVEQPEEAESAAVEAMQRV